MKFKYLAMAALVLSFPPPVMSAFKCESPDGKVTFTDQPCEAEEKSKAISIKKKKKSQYIPTPISCSAYEIASKISIGMSSAEVEDACGYPDDINRTTTARGVDEQWVYRGHRESAYVYITNGTVRTIQD